MGKGQDKLWVMEDEALREEDIYMDIEDEASEIVDGVASSKHDGRREGVLSDVE
jgi:hypothetical protein